MCIIDSFAFWQTIDGSAQDCSIPAQDCSIPIANAMELLQSCTKPSTWQLMNITNNKVTGCVEISATYSNFYHCFATSHIHALCGIVTPYCGKNLVNMD